MADLTVARTILAQLGGNRFRAMTGSTDFVGSDNSLAFRVRGRTKNRINKCRVTLNGKDLYDIEFYRYSPTRGTLTEVASVADIYNDQLQDVFTQYTGLDTHL